MAWSREEEERANMVLAEVQARKDFCGEWVESARARAWAEAAEMNPPQGRMRARYDELIGFQQENRPDFGENMERAERFADYDVDREGVWRESALAGSWRSPRDSCHRRRFGASCPALSPGGRRSASRCETPTGRILHKRVCGISVYTEVLFYFGLILKTYFGRNFWFRASCEPRFCGMFIVRELFRPTTRPESKVLVKSI